MLVIGEACPLTFAYSCYDLLQKEFELRFEWFYLCDGRAKLIGSDSGWFGGVVSDNPTNQDFKSRAILVLYLTSFHNPLSL